MFTTDNVDRYNYNNEKIWSLQRDEIGIVMWDNGKSFDLANTNPKKMHIPAIMGKSSPDGDPRIWSEGLNKSIYVNDPKCKPAVSSTVILQNYITVFHYANDYLQHKWLYNHAKLRLEVRNGDIDDIHVTDKIDPSFCEDCLMEHPKCHPLHSCGL